VAIGSDMVWDNQVAIDNKFIISFSDSSPVGSKIWRDTLDNTPHAGGNPNEHPTLNNVVKGGLNNILCAGAVTVRYDWSGDDNPPTSSDIDGYISYIQAENANQSSTLENIVKTSTSLEFDFVADKTVSGGPYSLFPYAPKASKAEYRIRDENTVVVCVLKIGDTPDVWTFVDYNIAAGEELTIDKQGTECYLLICSPSFIIGGTEIMVRKTPMYLGATALNGKSLKNMQSSSVTLRNTGVTAAKVGLLYK